MANIITTDVVNIRPNGMPTNAVKDSVLGPDPSFDNDGFHIGDGWQVNYVDGSGMFIGCVVVDRLHSGEIVAEWCPFTYEMPDSDLF
jgi:hypothetical protein